MSFREFYNEDCFVNMKVFKDKSINLILTSQFYNTNKKAVVDGGQCAIFGRTICL